MIRMDREDRRPTEIHGLGGRKLERLECSEERGHAIRVLEGVDDAPMHHELLRAMVELRIAEEELHHGLSSR